MFAPDHQTEPISLFYSYSHEDEELRTRLESHLGLLRHQGIIRDWHDRKIGAGTEWAGQIDEHLDSADIVLLLVSSDFLASSYCYDVEMARAVERHNKGEASVIPVILRPVDGWQQAPFGKLQALPRDGKAVTTWPNRDEAFTDVARGIRLVVENLKDNRRAETASTGSEISEPPSRPGNQAVSPGLTEGIIEKSLDDLYTNLFKESGRPQVNLPDSYDAFQSARRRYFDSLKTQHAQVRILGMPKPLPLESLYVRVRISEHVGSRR